MASLVNDCAFSKDGAKIITAGSAIKVWDIASTSNVSVFNFQPVGENEPPIASTCDISLDTEIAALSFVSHFGSALGVARINQPTGVVWGPTHAHNHNVNRCVFSRDESFIISCSDDRTLRLWQSHTAEVVTMKGHHNWVNWCCFSPDCSKAMTVSSDDRAMLWDLQIAKSVQTFVGHGHSVYGCDISVLDTNLAVTSSFDISVATWDIRTGAQTAKLKAHNEWIRCCVTSPTHVHTVISACDNGEVVVWDLRTQSVVQKKGCEGAIHRCAISRDGNKLLTSSGGYFRSGGNVCILWHLDGGELKPLKKLEGLHTAWVGIEDAQPST